MQLRLIKMIDRSDYGIATLAMISMWIASNPVAVWLSLHPSARWTMQAAGTILIGCGAVTAQYFLRNYLRRRWPERKATSEE